MSFLVPEAATHLAVAANPTIAPQISLPGVVASNGGEAGRRRLQVDGPERPDYSILFEWSSPNVKLM